MTTKAGFLPMLTDATMCIACAKLGDNWDAKELTLLGAANRLFNFDVTKFHSKFEVMAMIRPVIEEAGSYVFVRSGEPVFVITPIEGNKR